MTALDRARDDVAELIKVVDWLESSVMPGTAKPWHPPTISDERRNEMDALARAERLERTDIAPGDSPDPYDFTVADMLVDILARADPLAETVAHAAGYEPMLSASSAYADSRPFLEYIAHLLPTTDDHIVTLVSDTCYTLATRGMQALGLFTDGQLLAGTCPWCGGRSSRTPVGGAQTLRVRSMLGVGAVVVCEGRMCEPPSADVGTWFRGLPAWPMSEWSWLADRIEHAVCATLISVPKMRTRSPCVESPNVTVTP